jgi:multiple sugar transport system ATP-binding protein
MRTEIKKVHQTVKTTTVYVTHDQVEAMTLADRVVVMNAGTIEQLGTPHELYHKPKTKFVAGFIGSPAMNFLNCKLGETGGGGLVARMGNGLAFNVPAERTQRYKPFVGRDLVFGLRPEHIVERRGDMQPSWQEFSVTLDVVEPMGMETMVYFLVDGVEVCGRVDPAAAAGPGQPMRLVAELNHMHLIDPQSDAVI